MVERLTYPIKTNNPSDPDSINKFHFSEANDIKTVTDNHAEEIEAIQTQLVSSTNPFYGRFDSLSILQVTHPIGVLNAWAVIDIGAGITPQIAIWDNIAQEWEISGATQNIVFISNDGNLPPTGLINTWYITTDNYQVYIWNNTIYNLIGPTVIRNINIFNVKQISDTTIVDTGLNGISFENNTTNLTKVIFNVSFSKYLKAFAADQGSRTYIAKIFNKTKQISVLANINSLAFTDGTNNYYKADIINPVALANFSVNDAVEVFIDLRSTSKKVTFTSTVGQTVFVLTDTANNVDVILDRIAQLETVDYTYNLSTKTITLTDAASAGSILTVRKFY